MNDAMQKMMAQMVGQIKRDEGVQRTAYQDHLGYWTIGVGRLVDARKPGAGLRDDEIQMLLQNDIIDRVSQLSNRLPWFDELDEPRKGVLINMAFQLGVAGLLEFKRTLTLIQNGDYGQASIQMLLSKWAMQTPERARRLAKQMKTGEWQ